MAPPQSNLSRHRFIIIQGCIDTSHYNIKDLKSFLHQCSLRCCCSLSLFLSLYRHLSHQHLINPYRPDPPPRPPRRQLALQIESNSVLHLIIESYICKSMQDPDEHKYLFLSPLPHEAISWSLFIIPIRHLCVNLWGVSALWRSTSLPNHFLPWASSHQTDTH